MGEERVAQRTPRIQSWEFGDLADSSLSDLGATPRIVFAIGSFGARHGSQQELFQYAIAVPEIRLMSLP